MENISDIELVEQYLAGKKQAFEILMHRHIEAVYFFSLKLVGAEEANDMAQETFVKVWKHIKKFDTKKNFKVWLFRIARNTCLDHLRKKQPLAFSKLKTDDESDLTFEDTLSYSGPSPYEIVVSKDLEQEMKAMLSTLPLRTQEVFELYYRDGLNFAEIAEVLQISVNTAKSRHFRGLSELRKLIDNDAPKNP